MSHLAIALWPLANLHAGAVPPSASFVAHLQMATTTRSSFRHHSHATLGPLSRNPGAMACGAVDRTLAHGSGKHDECMREPLRSGHLVHHPLTGNLLQVFLLRVLGNDTRDSGQTWQVTSCCHPHLRGDIQRQDRLHNASRQTPIPCRQWEPADALTHLHAKITSLTGSQHDRIPTKWVVTPGIFKNTRDPHFGCLQAF